MKERSEKPQPVEIEEGEFYEGIMLSKQLIVSDMQKGLIPPITAQLQLTGIDAILGLVTEAEDKQLRVRYYKSQEGIYSYRIEKKGRIGYEGVRKV
jgi:hypothetical protein